MSFNIIPSKTILRQLGARSQRCRLAKGLSRPALSEMCGIPESTIKRFETSGEIGTRALVHIFISLGIADQLSLLAKSEEPKNIDEALKKPRKRGQRSDAGQSRKPSGHPPVIANAIRNP
ncbi:MAG: helix-turn-helix transcriptional regulator [Pseudomonadota bacterium]